MWLFRLPSVDKTLYFLLKTLLMSSFDVVLPLEPVIAITLQANLVLWKLASSWRQIKTSSTRICFSLFLYFLSSITQNEHPSESAWSAKRFPLKFLPLRLKKIVFFFICLLSVHTPSDSRNNFYISSICIKKPQLRGFYFFKSFNYCLLFS